ncbi:MAG: RHS repeat-associated core domain-containing protein [Candidatus Obscuribacter sp.]|nr:RHS repeat-associated core domain-containing protein [Candidatus Obscuribacter sp.]MBK9281903.1 RHS repeat-associated core domain-containing protein [Candidatus Obscuribacter sp.]
MSATSSGTVINILSASTPATSYTSSLSGGAIETVSLAPSTSANLYGYNNLNELTSIAAGGPTRFQGSSNKALKSASVDGNAASLPNTLTFRKNASLSSGSDSVPVSVTDGSNTTVSQNYKVSTKGSSSASPTFDANGNMTSDGTNTYEWDAENRLIKINYPGIGNSSQFAYDANGRNIKILEVVNGSITNTSQFVWCAGRRREERDSTGALTKKFFSYGQTSDASSRFFLKEHLGSILEVTSSGGAILAQNSFDPFGRSSYSIGAQFSDFGFAGYYSHGPSGLNLTTFRSYSPTQSRWLSRDPAGVSGDANCYAYVKNAPSLYTDSNGLSPQAVAEPRTPAPRISRPPIAQTAPKAGAGLPPWLIALLLALSLGGEEPQYDPGEKLFIPPGEVPPNLQDARDCHDFCKRLHEQHNHSLGWLAHCFEWCDLDCQPWNKHGGTGHERRRPDRFDRWIDENLPDF